MRHKREQIAFKEMFKDTPHLIIVGEFKTPTHSVVAYVNYNEHLNNLKCNSIIKWLEIANKYNHLREFSSFFHFHFSLLLLITRELNS